MSHKPVNNIALLRLTRYISGNHRSLPLCGHDGDLETIMASCGLGMDQTKSDASILLTRLNRALFSCPKDQIRENFHPISVF